MRTRSTFLLVLAVTALFQTLATTTGAAQAMKPAYLNEMPTVERVLREIQGSYPTETAARQMGAFMQLKRSFEDIARGERDAD